MSFGQNNHDIFNQDTSMTNNIQQKSSVPHNNQEGILSNNLDVNRLNNGFRQSNVDNAGMINDISSESQNNLSYSLFSINNKTQNITLQNPRKIAIKNDIFRYNPNNDQNNMFNQGNNAFYNDQSMGPQIGSGYNFEFLNLNNNNMIDNLSNNKDDLGVNNQNNISNPFNQNTSTINNNQHRGGVFRNDKSMGPQSVFDYHGSVSSSNLNANYPNNQQNMSYSFDLLGLDNIQKDKLTMLGKTAINSENTNKMSFGQNNHDIFNQDTSTTNNIQQQDSVSDKN